MVKITYIFNYHCLSKSPGLKASVCVCPAISSGEKDNKWRSLVELAAERHLPGCQIDINERFR